jgi:uncharacterized membrane protein
MDYIEEVINNLLTFDFTGSWWQYLLALIALIIILGIFYAIFESLPSGLLYFVAVVLGIIGAFALVELIQAGLALWKAFLDVAIVSSLLCIPLFYSANVKEKAEEK